MLDTLNVGMAAFDRALGASAILPLRAALRLIGHPDTAWRAVRPGLAGRALAEPSI